MKYLSSSVQRVVSDLRGGRRRIEGGGRVSGQSIGQDRRGRTVQSGHRCLHVGRSADVRIALVALKGRRRKEVDVAAMAQRIIVYMERIMHGGVRRMRLYRVKLSRSYSDRVGRGAVEDQLPLLQDPCNSETCIQTEWTFARANTRKMEPERR